MIRLSSLVILGASPPRPSRGRAPSFVNDVVPILTRLGCNQGACHGKGAGPERLPPVAARLRPGAGPPLDHPRVRRPPHQPRRARGEPAPAQAAGPGPARGRQAVRRAAAASTRLLLDWIRAGAPGPQKDDPKVDAARSRCPAIASLRPGEEQQLLVRAEYSDGQRTRRHLADAVRLQRRRRRRGRRRRAWSRSLRHGETAVRASFQGQVAVVVVTAPFEQPVEPERLAAKQQLHRRARLQQARRPAHRAVGPVRRRGVPPPRLPRHHRHAADAGRGAGVPGRQRPRQAGEADRPRCWSGRSSSITGRCSWATCCRTARSATTTSAAPRASARSTTGCASRWPPTGPGTSWPATC